jgi:hypothetical protein
MHDTHIGLMITMQLLYDYVLAAYERIGYIGHVLEDDVSDKTLHIDFIVESEKVVNRFRWPNKQDTSWINSNIYSS